MRARAPEVARAAILGQPRTNIVRFSFLFMRFAAIADEVFRDGVGVFIGLGVPSAGKVLKLIGRQP
jgi:hypothetical protein